MTNIALLDVNTVNYDDVDFHEIEALGDCKYANPRSVAEIIAACKDSEIVIVNKSFMSEEVISQLPKLKMIGLFATGYNNIDLDACKKRGIVCCNVPDYSTNSVAQHTFAMLLSFANSLPHYYSSVRDGYWIRSNQFSYYTAPVEEIKGKTLGIYGFGRIGRRVAKIADAFEMKVQFVNRSKIENAPYPQVSKEELFSTSDYISLHCPLNEGTANLINEETLSLMKPTALLINTARGGLIDEAALAKALKEKKIRGACLDVLRKEPMSAGCPLFQAPNCFITPHIAWAPIETRKRLISIVANNIKAFLNGKPTNVVSNQ